MTTEKMRADNPVHRNKHILGSKRVRASGGDGFVTGSGIGRAGHSSLPEKPVQALFKRTLEEHRAEENTVVFPVEPEMAFTSIKKVGLRFWGGDFYTHAPLLLIYNGRKWL
jgi:hypothetical protein